MSNRASVSLSFENLQWILDVLDSPVHAEKAQENIDAMCALSQAFSDLEDIRINADNSN